MEFVHEEVSFDPCSVREPSYISGDAEYIDEEDDQKNSEQNYAHGCYEKEDVRMNERAHEMGDGIGGFELLAAGLMHLSLFD